MFRVVRPDEFGGESEYSLGTKLVSEFIGTFYLVLTVGLNVLGLSPAPVWSIAAALMCMIFSLGNCSGGHFNPAVTLAVALRGGDKIAVGEIPAFMASQILGGIAAAYTYTAMEKGHTVPLGPGANYGWGAVA